MANRYNIKGVPPQEGIIPTPGNMNILAPRVNIPYTIVSELLKITKNGVEKAGTLEDAAQSVNAPIEQFNNIRNAMRIKGVDEEISILSTQDLYSKLNDLTLVNNEKYLFLSNLLNGYGTSIPRNENGTADITKTMLNIARVFPVMAQQDQNTLINTVGFNQNSIKLLREGEELGHLFSQARNLGNRFDPELYQRKLKLNDGMNKFGFLVDSWVDKQEDRVISFVTHGDYLADFISGFADTYEFDPDEKTLTEYLAEKNGYDMSWYKTVINDPEFTQQLNTTEYESLLQRIPFQSLDTKYRKYKQTKDDVAAINSMAVTGRVPSFISSESKFNAVTDHFYLGSETENIWRNNQLMDINGQDPYSLSPSSSLAPDNNIGSIPTTESPIYTDSAGGFNANAIADAIATAMQNNRVQIELTLIDSRSGESLVIPAQGGSRIAHAMQM